MTNRCRIGWTLTGLCVVAIGFAAVWYVKAMTW